MKRLLLSIAATLALAAAAMPTRDEMKKAAPIVGELMNPLVDDFRAKKKTAVEVGDTAVSYAREANTEAAKFLLLKGAVWYYAQAKEDGKAVAAIASLGEQVKDLPPKVLLNDILKPAIDRVGEQNVPGLFVQYRAASARAAIGDGKMSGNMRAELLSVAEGWPSALAAFAKLGDTPPAKAARAERSGKLIADAADFWWSYVPEADLAKDAIKAHAADLYRKAIASGELTGLKKAVAEKRIATLPAPAVSFSAAVPAASCGSAAPANSLYCVIDLSAGPNADKYPVSYLNAEPKGGFNTDEYKTTKLVLRRIEPGKFKMGGQYDVTLTKPYYMGVFEVTQKQYELVTGEKPSGFKGDMRPVEKVSYDMVRGKGEGAKWPTSSAVDSSSFMGKLRTRTGIDGFDLPTEAQWEYACRAGTTSKYNNGGDSEDDMKKLGRFTLNQKVRGYKESDADFARHEPDGKGGCLTGATVVGSYLPNAWGLYDMHGNVWEWCLDWRDKLTDGVTDPIGPSSSQSSQAKRVRRGGSWLFNARVCSLSSRGLDWPTAEGDNGLRLCMNPEGPVSASAQGSAAPAASGAQSNALYSVIDLSAGPNADKYPVSYLNAEPKGGWTDEYKTTKLVLRRIEPGTFKMCGKHDVTLTKPYYMGVFEVTQKQYELVTGLSPALGKGDDGMRPVENVSWNMIRGDSSICDWPGSAKVDPSTFMGKIQARTGVNFDLPTEAQWEYACRAGTTSQYNNGGDTEDDLKLVGRYEGNNGDRRGKYKRHANVGSYQPNVWGLYDMHGNVWEWCLDWYDDLKGGIDPVGCSSGTKRVARGGSWNNNPAACTSSTRYKNVPPHVGMYLGFRLCMNLLKQPRLGK